MNIDELHNLTKTAKNATEDDLNAIAPIYCMLDFDKKDFCKLIDAIGIDKWVNKASRWLYLEKAENEHIEKMNYINNVNKKAQLLDELNDIEDRINHHNELIDKRYGVII